MKAFVFAGGPISPELLRERPEEGDLIIAADAGWRNAQALGVTPGILVGDLDSLGQIDLPPETELLKVPTEKDDTDTQLAVRIALERGANEVVLIAGLGGRFDHTLSTLSILEDLHARQVRAILTDGRNRVRYLENGGLLVVRDGVHRYLSLIAVTERVRGVTLEGVRYPLKNATLKRSRQYAVSNEIEKNAALITVKRGAVYVIESTD